MRYTVIGTGAIGSYYGGRLQQSGLTVNYLARSDYAQLKSSGMVIESIDGDFKLEEIAAFKKAEDIPETDVILVSLKTTANSKLPDLIRPLVNSGTVILVLQNGLDMEEELRTAFPEARVMGGMCFICSFRKAPGHIVHVDKGSILAAPLDPADLPILKLIEADFIAAGIEFKSSDDLRTSRWSKLLWNIPFNGLSVVLNATTNDILSSRQGETIVRKLMSEVVQGARADGCSLTESQIEPMIDFTRVMTPYKPSMKLDFESGRPMEIDYMFRKPLKAAEKNGIELPSISMIADQLEILEGLSNQSQG